MEKYDLIPRQLMHEGVITEENLFEPEEMGEEVILLTHDAEYLRRLRNGEMSKREMREIGFPYSLQLIEREVSIMYGTVQAALFALEHGIAFNVAGGTHHAFADRGEGFCIFNDIAVGANYLLREGKARQILVIDLDVHQGNGTAALFADEKRVSTFSMHGKNNYPMRKEKSDLDVPLEDGTTDGQYLPLLEEVVYKLIDKVKPDFIFYQSGVDVLETDQLGRMKLTKAGCKERDYIVLTAAHKHGIPLTAVMGGGYSRKVADVVDAHCNLYKLASNLYS